MTLKRLATMKLTPKTPRKCSIEGCDREPIKSDRGVLFGICRECLDKLVGATR